MYCIKRDKYYSNDNTICPFMAYYNQSMMPFVPCYMANSNMVQGVCRPRQSFAGNVMPYGYSCLYSNNAIGNMGISMMPVPVEEIED